MIYYLYSIILHLYDNNNNDNKFKFENRSIYIF